MGKVASTRSIHWKHPIPSPLTQIRVTLLQLTSKDQLRIGPSRPVHIYALIECNGGISPLQHWDTKKATLLLTDCNVAFIMLIKNQSTLPDLPLPHNN